MRVSVVVPCVLLAGGLVSAASPAAPPGCGATVSVDTTLTRDLVCDGPGLRLEAGVDLDLGGHTVRGAAGGIGLEVSADGPVSVRNGTLTGWDTAVDTWGDEEWYLRGPLTVERVAFRDNVRGVDVYGKYGVWMWAKEATIRDSTFTRHSGYAVAESQGLTLERSTFTDNGVALFVGGSTQAVDVQFRRNEYAVAVSEGGTGTVTGSTFVDNTTGVEMSTLGEFTVRDSQVRGSDVAFRVRDDEARLQVHTSVLRRNATVVETYSWGIELVGNTVRDNGTTVRYLGDWALGTMTVRDNRFVRNDDGFAMADVPGALVLSGNVAERNSGWGIHAPGAVDEGGNRAWGNGNEPQCVGVVCAGRS